MKLILTSYLGGASKENGVRLPSMLVQNNGQLHTIRSAWPYNARVLIICSDPNDYEKNDSVCRCMKESLPMSSLSIAYVCICDNRNRFAVDDLKNIDVIMLAGGHVPTQNQFFQEIDLKNKIKCFGGLVIAWSAGSMNCAENVYAIPEIEGEAINPNYQRWIEGLGLTDINIFPHFQSFREEMLDDMRVIEDIVFPDSFTHDVVGLNDGSYIVVDKDTKMLCGEAYSIRDGKMKQICKNGEFIFLDND